MDSKYYTPKLDDLHFGSEFELRYYTEFGRDPKNSFWEKTKMPTFKQAQEVGNPFDIEFFISQGDIRVKILDKEDIESLGWKYKEINSAYGTTMEFEIGDMWKSDGEGKWIKVDKKDNTKVSIFSTDSGYNSDGPNYSCKFNGTIKNRNELKKIMQMLGLDNSNNNS